MYMTAPDLNTSRVLRSLMTENLGDEKNSVRESGELLFSFKESRFNPEEEKKRLFEHMKEITPWILTILAAYVLLFALVIQGSMEHWGLSLAIVILGLLVMISMWHVFFKVLLFYLGQGLGLSTQHIEVYEKGVRFQTKGGFLGIVPKKYFVSFEKARIQEQEDGKMRISDPTGSLVIHTVNTPERVTELNEVYLRSTTQETKPQIS